MKRHRIFHQIVPLGLLLVLGAACDKQSAEAPPPPPLEVSVTDVVSKDVPISAEWVGETRGRADVEIRARVQGFLEEVHFREGGRVKKGQLLYSIDQSELLQQKSAAQADLAAARTELAYAESDERRYRPLAEINAVSQRDLDSAVANREAAEARVEASMALLKLAEINLSYSRVLSPLDGLIGLTQAKVGDYVGQDPNPVVLNTVSVIDPIHVRFPIGELEYLDFARRFPQAGNNLESRELGKDERVPLELILADGTVHNHLGTPLFIERNIDASTGTITVEARFPNPELVLRPGQYGRVKGVVDLIEGALLVPQRSVSEMQGQFQVWVIGADNVAELRAVTMGRRVNNMWIVEDGLQAGERVVVDGIQRLRSGATVSAHEWEPPSTTAAAASGS